MQREFAADCRQKSLPGPVPHRARPQHWGTAWVGKGHGRLFPRTASRLWNMSAAAGCG